ncbi:MAG: glycosyltransferase family 2 protein [Promethearchaeota archaeon]|jgi:dolichol-phosphate mannosyltransferase
MKNRTDPQPIAVLIPTLNEEWGLGPTIKEINHYLKESLILVVDGRSTDSTTEVAKSLGVTVIFQKGLGKGDAIATAIEQFKGAKLEYLVIIDADFTYPAVYFDRMVEILEENPEVGMVCGNRFKAKLEFGDLSNKFRFGNKMLSIVHRLLNGVHMNDPLTGLRVVRWSILKDWVPKSKGFDIEVELNHLVGKSGFSIVEMPIDYRSRIGKKKLGIRHGFIILKRIILDIF